MRPGQGRGADHPVVLAAGGRSSKRKITLTARL
jgi:hypothetical protein